MNSIPTDVGWLWSLFSHETVTERKEDDEYIKKHTLATNSFRRLSCVRFSTCFFLPSIRFFRCWNKRKRKRFVKRWNPHESKWSNKQKMLCSGKLWSKSRCTEEKQNVAKRKTTKWKKKLWTTPRIYKFRQLQSIASRFEFSKSQWFSIDNDGEQRKGPNNAIRVKNTTCKKRVEKKNSRQQQQQLCIYISSRPIKNTLVCRLVDNNNCNRTTIIDRIDAMCLLVSVILNMFVVRLILNLFIRLYIFFFASVRRSLPIRCRLIAGMHTHCRMPFFNEKNKYIKTCCRAMASNCNAVDLYLFIENWSYDIEWLHMIDPGWIVF